MEENKNITRGRVLLIYPPSNNIENKKSNNSDNKKNTNIFFNFKTFITEKLNKISKISKTNPPLDLMYLASIAKSCNYEVKIGDYREKNNIIKDLKEFQPHFLVAEISMQHFYSDMECVKVVKELFPSCCTIVKGLPFLTYTNNAIYENQFIDYIMYGENEFTLKDILNGVPNQEILGICYRENFQSIKTDIRPFIENLDLLPYPERELIQNTNYNNSLTGKNQTIIELARGCSNNCFHCLEPIMCGNKPRLRKVENIITEIEICLTKFNINNFEFFYKTYNIDNNFLEQLCTKIIEKKFKISWQIELKPNPNINDTLLKLMYKSGCKKITLTNLSGSDSILKNIEGGITTDDICKISKKIQNNKIKLENKFLLGLPWETKETFETTIELAIKLNSDFVSFSIPAPFPATKYFTYAMLNHLQDDKLNFSKANHSAIVKTHSLKIDEINKLEKKGLKSYYLRLSFFFDKITKIRSLEDLKIYSKIYTNLFLQ